MVLKILGGLGGECVCLGGKTPKAYTSYFKRNTKAFYFYLGGLGDKKQ
jgi:hypothetical protein